MKILWLCHYSLLYFKEFIDIDFDKYEDHPGTWIHNLSREFLNYKDVELYIISSSSYIKKDICFRNENITYNFISKKAKRSSNKAINNVLKINRFIANYIFKNKIKKIVKRYSPDLINVHGTEFNYALLVNDLKIPVVVWLQGVMNLVFKNMSSKSANNLKNNEKEIFGTLKYFVSKKGNMENEIRKFNPDPKLFYIYYPVSNYCFELKELDNEVDASLIFVGSIMKRKGVEDFIDIIDILKSKIRNLKSKIAGPYESPDYFKFIKKKLIDLNLNDEVRVLGKLPEHRDVLREIKKSEILVLPTYADSAPVVVAEAMSMGVPVIAYLVDGLPEMIKDGYNGILVETGNVKALADAALDLLNNPEKRKYLADNAFESAKKEFYAPSVAGKTFEMYSEIIREMKKVKSEK